MSFGHGWSLPNSPIKARCMGPGSCNTCKIEQTIALALMRRPQQDRKEWEYQTKSWFALAMRIAKHTMWSYDQSLASLLIFVTEGFDIDRVERALQQIGFVHVIEIADLMTLVRDHRPTVPQ